jgi:hypothetical protein
VNDHLWKTRHEILDDRKKLFFTKPAFWSVFCQRTVHKKVMGLFNPVNLKVGDASTKDIFARGTYRASGTRY